jgi:bisphosphoglycerate-independent phosphoglycerate mutase (AlkP superfamily)
VVVNIEASRMHKPFVDNYCELEDVGHMGMFEAEKESLNLVRSFLENIS